MKLKDVMPILGKVEIVITVENGYPVVDIDLRHKDDPRIIEGNYPAYAEREVREITTKVFSDRTIYIDLK